MLNDHLSEAIHPPLPTDDIPTGQELLRLLRLYENTPDDCDLFEQVVELLQLLISTISRRGGMFYGSVQDAQTILENASAQATKRGKQKTEDRKTQAGPTVDSQLLVSAILRILNPNHPGLLVALAADLVNTICQTIRVQDDPDTCTIASFEIMASSGKQFLQQLASVGQNTNVADDVEEAIIAKEAVLQAAAALVTLFGIKLSRSTDLLNSLSEWAWNTLFFNDDSKVQRAAARLLTAIPSGPRLEEVLSCLMIVLSRTIPAVQQNRDNAQEEGILKNSAISKFLDAWMDRIHETSDNTKRGEIFLGLVHGLVTLGIQLLGRPDESSIVKIHVELVLKVIETMMMFPLTAETSFHSTNKRLRAEYLDGGLLNTIVLARDVANVVFIRGLSLLDGMLSATPPLPYTRNILQITHAALRTSSSASVRQVIDPSSAMQFTGSRRRWLNRSIPARIAAIQSFRSALLACGPDPLSSGPNNKKNQECSRDIEQSVQYVSGFLLESLKLSRDVLNVNGRDMGEWGSALERNTMMTVSAKCLTTVLTVGGEYLSLNMRNLIESITFECLEQVNSGRNPFMDSVNCEFLRLASACVQVPWRDGAASSLSDELLRASTLAARGQERLGLSATEAAYAATRSSESAMFPRIPALSVVRSRPVDEKMYAEFSALSRAILEHINSDQEKKENTSLKRLVPLQEVDEAAMSKKSKLIAKEQVSVSTTTLEDEERQTQSVSADLPRAAKSDTEKESLPTRTSPPPPSASREQPSPKVKETKVAEGEDESDEDLPMIFDCGPDEEDVE